MVAFVLILVAHQLISLSTIAAIDPASFYGKLRSIYSETVLKTQLEQMKKQGSYEAFKLQWHPAYDVRRLYGAKTRVRCEALFTASAFAIADSGILIDRRNTTLSFLGVGCWEMVSYDCQIMEMSPFKSMIAYTSLPSQDRGSMLLSRLSRRGNMLSCYRIQSCHSRISEHD